MIIKCSSCRKSLQFTQVQQKTLDTALSKLTKEEDLTIKCPHCQRAVKLAGTNATLTEISDVIRPPAPPDIDWLKTGTFAGKEQVQDVPMAMVLYGDSPQRVHIVDVMKSVGYQVLVTDTHEEAMKRMQFVNFSCVVLNTHLEQGKLADSTFHNHMRDMPMEKRRYIFYILIGPDLHTLWNLEAMSASANLTVCEKDLKHFDVIVRKAIPYYEELFGPLLEELAVYGAK